MVNNPTVVNLQYQLEESGPAKLCPLMGKIVKYGRLVFAFAIMAFGMQNLICARLGLAVRGVPWFPQDPFPAYLPGIALLAAGLSIAANIAARLTAVMLGIGS